MKQTKNTKYVYIPKERLEELKQFIRGSILGDGYIGFTSKMSKNASMKFCHSEKQLPYLAWKQSFLKSFDLATESEIGCYRSFSKRYKKGYCDTFRFSSKTHPIFTFYRELYYNNSKRILNKEDILNINELALAIWYMDDGYVFNRKNRSSKLVLCTDSFSKEDVLFLMELIWSKWNIKTSYYKTKNEIIISSSDSEKFVNLIKPYIQNCLIYKTKLVHVKRGELLENP